MKTNFRWIAILVAASFFSISLIVTPTKASADVIGPAECFPAVLMLKGSGEGVSESGVPVSTTVYSPNNDLTRPFIKTNGHEGERIGNLLKAFVNKTDPAKTVSKVRFIGIEYPALPVVPEMPDFTNSGLTAAQQAVVKSAIWADHIIAYNESYRTGAQMTVDFINNEQRRGCDTQYMLVSYSQGVIAARLAMNLLGNRTDTVVSSYVFGDPFQKAEGASSSKQVSIANTSPQTSGVGRLAASLLTDALEVSEFASLFTGPTVAAINEYTDEITQADPVIYRDDGAFISRTLCHAHDPTCGISDFSKIDINEHTNYFQSGNSKGDVDIAYEVAEFDKQVQVLANSTNSNPRQRTIAKTPSIRNEVTTYNVVNTRPDDFCRWDEGSDNVVDYEAPCGTYNVVHPYNARMTVTIVDSFGVENKLASDTRVLDPGTNLNLASNNWYQFQPYVVPEALSSLTEFGDKLCLNKWQAYSVNVDSYGSLELNRCAEFGPDNRYAYDTGQLFQYTTATSQGTGHRLAWGYDDRYVLTQKSPYDVGIDFVSYPNANQDFEVKLTNFIANVPYYSIIQGSQCLTLFDYGVALQPCDVSNLSQLFEAKIVEGQFGNLSIERDVTAPTPVTGLHVSATLSSATLKWEDSTDVRASYVDYKIYKKDNFTGEFKLVKTSSTESYNLDKSTMPEGSSHTYKVLAVDFAGHESVSDTITFTLPAIPANAPVAPTVVEENTTNQTVTIQFDKLGNPNARIRLYERNSFSETLSGVDTYTTNAKGYSLFSYEVETSPNVYSPKSEGTWVQIPY